MEAKIYNFSKWIDNTDKKILFNYFNNALNVSEFIILNFIDYDFIPYGYTCLWLIAESHFAIHTFPEKNKTYIELSSCNKEKKERFIEYINEVKL